MALPKDSSDAQRLMTYRLFFHEYLELMCSNKKNYIYTYRVPKSTLNTARDFADVAFNILKGRNCSAMSRVTIQEVY